MAQPGEPSRMEQGSGNLGLSPRGQPAARHGAWPCMARAGEGPYLPRHPSQVMPYSRIASMRAASAWPFSVSEYSTFGGTSA